MSFNPFEALERTFEGSQKVYATLRQRDAEITEAERLLGFAVGHIHELTHDQNALGESALQFANETPAPAPRQPLEVVTPITTDEERAMQQQVNNVFEELNLDALTIAREKLDKAFLTEPTQNSTQWIEKLSDSSLV